MQVLSSAKMQMSAVALLLLGFGSPAHSQTYDELTLQVRDVNDPDAPIKVAAGQVTFKQEIDSYRVKSTCAMHVELENVSFRTVLAYEVSFFALPHYGGAYSRVDRSDNFFTQNVTFTAGSKEALEYDCSRTTAQANERGPLTPRKYTGVPRAELKLVFVEFLDGARYGTSDWGDHLSEGRADTTARLKELLQAYRSGGETALHASMAQALARPDNPEYTQDALRIFDHNLQTGGIEAFVSKLNERLKAAQEHANVM